jgi:hypothetical protein
MQVSVFQIQNVPPELLQQYLVLVETVFHKNCVQSLAEYAERVFLCVDEVGENVLGGCWTQNIGGNLCLNSLCVAEKHRQHGIGALLLKAVTSSCVRVFLYVDRAEAHDWLCAFYSKNGFSKVCDPPQGLTLAPEVETLFCAC